MPSKKKQQQLNLDFSRPSDSAKARACTTPPGSSAEDQAAKRPQGTQSRPAVASAIGSDQAPTTPTVTKHADGSAVLLSVRDFARLSGFSEHTIRDWLEQGLLPGQKIGNRWRLERDRAILALKNLNKKRRRKRDGYNPT